MKKKLYMLLTLTLVLILAITPIVQAHASAGLAAQFFSPDYRYKIDITNIHSGWAGPWAETQNINHTNIHVYDYGNELHNYHVSAKTSGWTITYYVYDSRTGNQWTQSGSVWDKASVQSSMQNSIINDINSSTNWAMVGTVAAAIAIVAIVWIFFPWSTVALIL